MTERIKELAKLNGLNEVMNLVIEECSELIKEMTKAHRGMGDVSNIEEEIADVVLVVNQLMHLLDITDADIEKTVEEKVERTMQTYYE